MRADFGSVGAIGSMVAAFCLIEAISSMGALGLMVAINSMGSNGLMGAVIGLMGAIGLLGSANCWSWPSGLMMDNESEWLGGWIF